MKAIVQYEYGSPDVLAFADVETPRPAAGEVLVRVQAASVNARDWHVLRGDPYVARPSADLGWRRPNVTIRGTDFAGRVEAVGPAVTGVQIGSEVYGEAPRAFAEYVAVPQDRVAAKPATLGFEEAAALPLAANTALTGLRDAAKVEAGQQVLINGAAGGVGTFAIQLGKALGATVTAVCSTRNVELVSSLGADDVVDYTTSDFSRLDRRYDVVLDLVGNRSLTALRRVLVRRGTLVLSGGGLYGGGSVFGPLGLIIRGQLSAPFVSQRVVVFDAVPSSANLTTLREYAEAGRLTPVLDRTYPLSAAAEAIRYVEAGHARGKVVISV
ncbi:NAD(P)-dependent alcohol dehydrogenase [Kribbella shirazensis]|uniref:NADPH:quinone reductase-like Zn-dependent oxidoreductase n=1 Tax=Kribbella shirazensis TaxID=1105143 RepID=A0A7X5VLR2_9ACTN|nr:NAD(P)-dependent alcohol dehydrogenase [Kribbella shirazensis]NIK62378.1 NADPH:quinone reductase-like Zn-dependent oxidoreductase [Kribbella shirazensis]